MCKAKDIQCAGEKLNRATIELLDALDEGIVIQKEAQNGNHKRSH